MCAGVALPPDRSYVTPATDRVWYLWEAFRPSPAHHVRAEECQLVELAPELDSVHVRDATEDLYIVAPAARRENSDNNGC